MNPPTLLRVRSKNAIIYRTVGRYLQYTYHGMGHDCPPIFLSEPFSSTYSNLPIPSTHLPITSHPTLSFLTYQY